MAQIVSDTSVSNCSENLVRRESLHPPAGCNELRHREGPGERFVRWWYEVHWKLSTPGRRPEAGQVELAAGDGGGLEAFVVERR